MSMKPRFKDYTPGFKERFEFWFKFIKAFNYRNKVIAIVPSLIIQIDNFDHRDKGWDNYDVVFGFIWLSFICEFTIRYYSPHGWIKTLNKKTGEYE